LASNDHDYFVKCIGTGIKIDFSLLSLILIDFPPASVLALFCFKTVSQIHVHVDVID